jgi:glycosyltransferase involved in cell wall biosynthesis
MPICHFSYSVPGYRVNNIIARMTQNLQRRLFNYGFVNSMLTNRNPTMYDLSQWPVRSPYENTKHTYLALSKQLTTKLYHCTEKTNIPINPDDVFLGHPYFPFTGRESGVTEKVIHSKNKPRIKALISPLHCDTSVQSNHLNGTYLSHVNELLRKSDILFGIMGEFWWNEWDKSIYADWKPKMVRLDMAVDINSYPFIKLHFNIAGERKFLFIGNNNPNKNTAMLTHLAEKLEPESIGWIGSGNEIPGVKRISSDVALTPDFMKEIARRYDFFISTSLADANPTTILESMAWGFPVVCTPQSGYYETEYLFNIDAKDIDKSISILNHLQFAPANYLIEVSLAARKVVKNTYNWDNFTDKIIHHLGVSK